MLASAAEFVIDEKRQGETYAARKGCKMLLITLAGPERYIRTPVATRELTPTCSPLHFPFGSSRAWSVLREEHAC